MAKNEIKFQKGDRVLLYGEIFIVVGIHLHTVDLHAGHGDIIVCPTAFLLSHQQPWIKMIGHDWNSLSRNRRLTP